MGSAIIRPHRMDQPILGNMAKSSTVGILFAAPLFIYRLGHHVPALYPSIDLFLAPFLAQAAAVVDSTLFEDYASNGGDYPDELFFGTFAVLSGIGMLFSGGLLWLAAKVKLANLGTFLPFSVLCGFFSAVGVLLWALAFSVDTTGKTWQMVFFSGDSHLIWNSCIHHLPSLVVGILMNRLGPKHPFYVILLILVTLLCFYATMWITGTSLEQAQQRDKWFWSPDELVYAKNRHLGLESWTLPPAPLGRFGALWNGLVHWKAVYNGLGNMAALAFLYLLRSSIHASALKKNVGNLVRRVPLPKTQGHVGQESFRPTTPSSSAYNMASSLMGSVRQSVQTVNISLAPIERMSFGEVLDLELPSDGSGNKKIDDASKLGYKEIRAKATHLSLEEIFVEYGYALFVVAFCGGFGCCPTVATSNTMYAIGAEAAAPQYGSVLLLIIFYLTDFELVQYIPKAAFSSLLVLGAVDTFVVWFFGAFRKTQDIFEWLVVPIIVAFSLFVGFLNAVFFGIAISMFVFVGSFFQVGVVKFKATALEVRSTIERPMASSLWLDEHGDSIQVFVLQNYLFFGNANSILNYIATMFDDDVDDSISQGLEISPPPSPKILILDMSLITGMDSSTVDIFADIKELCHNHDCKLYMCGLSPRIRKGLAMRGIKPESAVASMDRRVRFFVDLDTALGKAEDALIQSEMTEIDNDESMAQSTMNPREGFFHALKQIDEQHGQDFAHDLFELQPYTVPLELEPGQFLFQCHGGIVQDCQRGLFFIESGQLKIEKDASQTLTRTIGTTHTLNGAANVTLKNQHARMSLIARKAALAKARRNDSCLQNFRLARIGPGW